MPITKPNEQPVFKIITLTYETLEGKKKKAYWNKDAAMWMYYKPEATVYGSKRTECNPALPSHWMQSKNYQIKLMAKSKQKNMRRLS